MTTMRSWSSSALGDDAAKVLAVFQESLPVRLIATARADFKTCLPDEELSAVVQRSHADGFDFLPVVDPDVAGAGSIAGVLDVASHASGGTAAHSVRDVMQPLGENHLIGADASILTFIHDADRHPFRFVVSGREISGLVTLSDLQRLPVRAALFALVTQLEMTMTTMIRQQFAGQDAWMHRLSLERREKVTAKLQAAKHEDTLVDPLLYTEFGDKVAVIKKAWPLFPNTSPSKTQFQKDMDTLQKLRDNLAHANNYAATRAASERTCESVRRMMRWIGLMTEWCSEQPRPSHRIPSVRD